MLFANLEEYGRENFGVQHMGCILGQQDETRKKEFTIYYLSKKFTDCELRYSTLEKTCCALAWAEKRLRQYMLNHTTWLISKTCSYWENFPLADVVI